MQNYRRNGLLFSAILGLYGNTCQINEFELFTNFHILLNFEAFFYNFMSKKLKEIFSSNIKICEPKELK